MINESGNQHSAVTEEGRFFFFLSHILKAGEKLTAGTCLAKGLAWVKTTGTDGLGEV